jgi:hypothetical protein
VTALFMAAQTWSPSNEAPRPVTRDSGGPAADALIQKISGVRQGTCRPRRGKLSTRREGSRIARHQAPQSDTREPSCILSGSSGPYL